MALLPKISRFQSEDFGKDQRKWIGKLLQPLNSFMTNVVAALDRNISVNQNMQGQIKAISVTGGSTTKFKYEPSQRPAIVLVGKVLNPSGALVANPVTCVDWSDDGAGNITVESIPNLTSGTKYTVTFLILS